MATMTIQRLHDLFDENPEKDLLEWQGRCHDCQCEVKVTVDPQVDRIHINGGGIYEPVMGQFVIKCDGCFSQDPVLRNYQPCEVYSRVVGYLRPVNQWNDAKTAEFNDRRLFDASVRQLGESG